MNQVSGRRVCGNGPRAALLAVSFLLLLVVGLPSARAACPGGLVASTNYVQRTEFGSGSPSSLFHFVGSGCTFMLLGAATDCTFSLNGAGTGYHLATLFARWEDTAARLGDAGGGCSFMCGGGDCFLGNDGLPVELLRFGVE